MYRLMKNKARPGAGLVTEMKLKEKRWKEFHEGWLDRIALEYDVSEHVSNGYLINTEEHGLLEYYPKSDRLLIRKENDWKSLGLNWIEKNLLK